MTMKVLFNGAVLVKPGGATKVDASLFASAGLAGVGVVALIGEADGGEPDSVQIFTTPEKAREVFRSGPLADTAKLAFQPANDARVPGGAQRLVCIKVNQSTPSSKTFTGTGTQYAQTTAANSAPYNIEPSQTVVVVVNGGGPQTATFTATQASVSAGGAGAYSGLTNGQILNVITDSGNGGAVQALTLAGLSAKTAAEVAGILNPLVLGGFFEDNAGTLRFKSDTKGTSGKVQVTGGNANSTLAFSTSAVFGTGNVGNIDAVTAAEAKTVIEAAVTGVTVSGSPVIIQSNLASTGTIQVTGASTATGFGFDALTHTAVAPVNVMTVTSKDFGAHTLKVAVQISDSGGGKVVEITFEDGLKRTTETSPIIASTAEFTIQYTGNATTAVMTVSSSQITTTLANDQTDGSVDLTIPFATYSTLQEILNYVNGQTGYTATAVTSNPYTFDPADLDYVASVAIKASPYSAYAKLFRVIDWINGNSSLVDAARVASGPTAPLATTGKVYLTGGARGSSTNTNWQDAFDALGAVRVNEVAPLISRDLAALGQGSTATYASVAAQLDAHIAFFSSTKGKNERQGYTGMKGSKSQVLAQAGILNSFNTVLSAQKMTVLNSANTLQEMEEYAFAVMLAGMRAGSDLGEPLTWKYLRANDVTQDASWNPQDDGEDMILGGVLYAESVPNKGIRIVKGITTYTREDNDAYTEESVVMGWKNVAFELRQHVEDLFTGRKVSPQNITAVKSAAEAKLGELRSSGQIVDSVLSDGTRLLAYRELSVSADGDTVIISVVVSPVSGINFTLNNIFLVPAQISA